MPADLSGKVVVLTGGADGIGRECALAYARAEAAVAILDRDLERAQRHCLRSWRGVHRSSSGCVGWRSGKFRHLNCPERFGRIDAVHNNAGIASPSKPLHETPSRNGMTCSDQRQVGLLDDAVRLPGTGGKQGRNSEYSQPGGPDGAAESCGVRGQQGRHDFADQGHGCRLRALLHSRECGVSRRGLDSDAGEVVRRANPTRKVSASILTTSTCSDPVAWRRDRGCGGFSSLFQARFITGCILPVSGGAEWVYKR